MQRLRAFYLDKNPRKVFLLKGFAGTGKTTLMAYLVSKLPKTILMAPTGRAAKVFSGYSHHPAFSIHKAIYRQEGAGNNHFSLDYNRHDDTIFIIDESSMISNLQGENRVFGSGRLLDDLIEYIYTSKNSQAIFVGDPAQLLPVGENCSPAMDRKVLEGYGLKVYEATLTDVIRQATDSGILFNATQIRRAIETEPFVQITLNANFDDIERVSGEYLIDNINKSYNTVGEENTVILTYSNKRAVLFNRGIRAQVLYREERIQAGDLVMVTKNNYYWSKPYKELPFIANGDVAEVIRVSKHYDLYGGHFADLTLRLMDYDIEITAKVLLDSLETENPAAVQALNDKIASNIAEDYPDIRSKAALWKELKENEFYNALQIKFAYSITGHKSQGGAWEHVYIDLGYVTDEMITREYYQWLYTAFTRAKERLYLVNFPDKFFE